MIIAFVDSTILSVYVVQMELTFKADNSIPDTTFQLICVIYNAPIEHRRILKEVAARDYPRRIKEQLLSLTTIA